MYHINRSSYERASINAIEVAVEKLNLLAVHVLSPTVTVSKDDLDFQLNISKLLKREFMAARKTLLEQLASTIAYRRQRLSYELRHFENPKRMISSNVGDISCPFCVMSMEDPAANYYEKSMRIGFAPLSSLLAFSHVDKHAMPYVCLSEDCSPSSQFFVHFQDWIEHMNTLHSEEWARYIHRTTWFCDIEHPNVFEFEDQESFEAHMFETALHPRRGRPTDGQLAVLSRRKKKMVARELLFCPLCECIPTEVQQLVDSPGTPQARSSLSKHIGEHLQSLAKLSHHLLQSEPPQTDLSVEDWPPVSLISLCDSTDAEDFALPNDELITSFNDTPGADSNTTQDQNIPDIVVDEFAGLLSHVWSSKLRDVDSKVVENFGKHKAREATEQSLRTKLARAQVKSALDDRKFVPTDLIMELVTREAVWRELHLAGITSNHMELSENVFQRARKVCAVLVYIGKVSSIPDFLQNDFFDSCLPMPPEQLEHEKLYAASWKSKQWNAFAYWSYPEIELFYDSQWAFLAPVFSTAQFEYVLPNPCPLPFTWINRNNKKIGLFSIIQEAAVQPGHLYNLVMVSLALLQVSKLS
jgi:hypothetical protein